MVSLDAIDKKILELLAMDSRMTVRDISRKLDVSPSTVSRKIKHMEEEGAFAAEEDEVAHAKGPRRPRKRR